MRIYSVNLFKEETHEPSGDFLTSMHFDGYARMSDQRIFLLIPSVCKRLRTISSELHKASERNKEPLHQREQGSRFFPKSGLNLQQYIVLDSPSDLLLTKD